MKTTGGMHREAVHEHPSGNYRRLAPPESATGRSQPERPIRILHVMDKLSVEGSRIAGPARQLAYRLPQYPRERYSTLVVSLRAEDAAREFLEQSGLAVTCLERGKFDPRTLVDLRCLARDWRPDILHLHGYASWTFGRIVGRWDRIPVVVQEHFVDAKVPRVQRIADWVLGKQQRLALAVSEAVREFMRHERFVRATPVNVIWNAVPVEKIREEAALADTAALRASLAIPPDAPVIGTVGRLAEMKGQRYFLLAAASIRRQRPDAFFVVVGAGPLRNELEALTNELGLNDRVRFVGHQSAVVPYLALFEVCVLTSIYGEGFHTVALESLAAGTPVVMTDLSVYAGLYANERDVLIVPVRDPEAAAAATLRLLEDAALAGALLENAERLLASCSLPAVVGNYLNLYERLVPTAGGGQDGTGATGRHLAQGAG